MEAAETTETNTVSRTLKLDLFLSEENKPQYQRVLSSIRQYRATLRHCFSILATSHAAGATFDWKGDELRVKPSNESARQILALSTGKDGAALGYQLRDHVLKDLCPTWMSFVWDSLRRDLQTAWNAPDPEFPKAKKGWLVLQGSRGISQFNRRGIGFPPATARPKLADHSLTLKWDHELGSIGFKYGSMDQARWSTLKSLMRGDDKWKIGTVFLSENDGKIFALITHDRPKRNEIVEGNRVMRVNFNGEGDTLCTMVGPDGESTFDRLESFGLMAFLDQHEKRRIELEKRRETHGSPRLPWGHRKGWLADQNVLDRLTINRTRRVQDYNHAWTRRIIARAVSWRCGVVELGPLPETFGRHSWTWSDLKSKLNYKATERGISFVEVE